MNEIIPSTPVPLPSLPITVRVGTRDDIPFIDALQKKYGKALGFFPRAQLEGYIDNGWVLVAEGVGSGQWAVGSTEEASSLPTAHCPPPTPMGYCLSRDRYLKRDELGVIYQLCVSPSAQRGLIGATLIREVFERSAYGCRLYCCWCAQDLAANRFWESLGFVPIAFRGGSSKKSRVHIFWQKRIRAGDASTPWWFPAKTEGGAMREDRIVLPIPPGVAWRDPMPVMVASEDRRVGTAGRLPRTPKASGDGGECPPYGAKPRAPTKMRRTGMQSGPPGAMPFVGPTPEPTIAPATIEKPTVRAPARERAKVDPKLVAAARELRDRYLEHVNADASPLIVGKYDVSKTLSSVDGIKAIEAKAELKLLAA